MQKLSIWSASKAWQVLSAKPQHFNKTAPCSQPPLFPRHEDYHWDNGIRGIILDLRSTSEQSTTFLGLTMPGSCCTLWCHSIRHHTWCLSSRRLIMLITTETNDTHGIINPGMVCFYKWRFNFCTEFNIIALFYPTESSQSRLLRLIRWKESNDYCSIVLWPAGPWSSTVSKFSHCIISNLIARHPSKSTRAEIPWWH